MRAGIVGLPQAGKTTIFSILTRAALDTTTGRGRKAEPNVGVVAVPDSRVDFLAGRFHPRKTTLATVEFVDVGGVTVQGSSALDSVRDVDALVHVVRAFEDLAVPHPGGSIDVPRDIRNFDADLILTDLGSIEKRLERLEKDLRKMKDPGLQKERDFLVEARTWLESERPLREMAIDPALARTIRGFAFLSEKPMLYAINVGEDAIGSMDADTYADGTERPNTETVVVCGKLEAEMAQLGEDEIGTFLEDYGLAEPGMVRLIRSTYHLLGLISFLTAGEEECRAWTIRKGTRAQQAAGAIHSDLEKHFIRAEVAAFSDFQEHGGFPALREKGLLRLEGKDYVVADGDILTIRHSG